MLAMKCVWKTMTTATAAAVEAATATIAATAAAAATKEKSRTRKKAFHWSLRFGQIQVALIPPPQVSFVVPRSA